MIERKLSSGVGRLVLASSKLAVTESFLPTGTSQMTASLAAIVRISAQETIPGHSDSAMFFTLSISSKPFKEWMLLQRKSQHFQFSWPSNKYCNINGILTAATVIEVLNLNKAVMEVEPNYDGSVSRIRSYCTFHFLPNNIKHSGAC
ncbi:hypothetical protein Lal_00025134 [Lupinus albus]|nr:hypothetical protein Lal_00025134 [Lupinus albus]